MADDEGHLLRRRVHRGDDQVALVLAVVVIGDDDDLATGEGVDGLRGRWTGTRFCSPDHAARLVDAVGGQEFRIGLTELGDGQLPQDSAGANYAVRRILERADALFAGEAVQQFICVNASAVKNLELVLPGCHILATLSAMAIHLSMSNASVQRS